MAELIDTFKEEYQGALDEQQKQRYKNSAILFSKALFALCDLLIEQKLHKLPFSAQIQNGIKTIAGTEPVPEEIRKIAG